MRKQTALWTTKDGTKIRICDMDDSHLVNTIHMLEKATGRKTQQAIDSGFQVLGMLQGEMAIESVEHDLDQLTEHGLEPENEYPIYSKLISEAIRREIKYV